MKTDTWKCSPLNAGLLAAIVCGSLVASAASAHTITKAEGDVEASASYIGNDGTVIKTGMGECLRSSKWSADAAAAVCEGGEAEAAPETTSEPAAKTEEVETPEPVATVETMTLDGVGLFATNSDQLTGEGEAKIQELLAEMQSFKGILGIEVTGHTDSRGSEEYNQSLSQRRAETVQAMLLAQYPDVPINAVGMGESSPVASNSTAEGRQANRRVEVAVNASRMVFN